VGCIINDGPFGTYYLVPEDPGARTLTKDRHTYAEVECWWASHDRTFIIRQENSEAADVLELSQGQLYDLLDAINRALGLPGPTVDGKECV
jgi:hypothetical protein